MTRPTDCTTSTWELRADKKSTASRVGTSTPSLRQRTLVRIRHSLPSIGALSQPRSSSRSGAECLPSICLEETDIICSFFSEGRASRYDSVAVLYVAEIFLEASMLWQNATARRIGAGS